MLVVDLLVVKETIAVREMIAGLDLAVEEAVQVLVLRPVATKEIVALIWIRTSPLSDKQSNLLDNMQD